MRGFYQWLDDLVGDKRVHSATFRVAYILARKADDQGRAWPDQELIKSESTLSDNGARKAIRQLAELGYIETKTVVAGDKLPSGFVASRTRLMYAIKSPPSPAQSSGEQSSPAQSSGEQSSPAQSSGTPLHRVRLLI
jgi:hypothetical protein